MADDMPQRSPTPAPAPAPDASSAESGPVILGITGTNGAGKGTVVEFLVAEYGFQHYSARGLLSKLLREQGKELTRSNMNVLANKLRADNHPAILAQKLLEQAQEDAAGGTRGTGRAIIESIRTPGEANLLGKNKNFRLLAVDADSRVRYERVVVRGSSTDKVSYEQFVHEEEREMTSTDPNKQNVSQCIRMAHATLKNEGSVEELRKQLVAYLAKINITQPVAVRINQVAQVVRVKIAGGEAATKLDVLLRGPALKAVREQPGFVKITRQFSVSESVYEISIVFDSDASFTGFKQSPAAKEFTASEFMKAVTDFAIDGKVYNGARVHDDF